MSTSAIELPPDLDARLEIAVGLLREEKSRLVRQALESYLDARSIPATAGMDAPGNAASRTENVEANPKGPRRKPRPGSALELAGDLVGSIEGPGDLSTNPKYMEGYGR